MADLTPIPLTARPQKDVVLIIEGVAYQRHVSNINFAPDGGGKISWHGGTPDADVTDSTQPTGATANITCIQAWDDPDSLCRFLFEHAGEKAEVSYRPHRDSAFTVYSIIDLMPPVIGGPTNAFNEATVACPATKPTATPQTIPTPAP